MRRVCFSFAERLKNFSTGSLDAPPGNVRFTSWRLRFLPLARRRALGTRCAYRHAAGLSSIIHLDTSALGGPCAGGRARGRGHARGPPDNTTAFVFHSTLSALNRHFSAPTADTYFYFGPARRDASDRVGEVPRVARPGVWRDPRVARGPAASATRMAARPDGLCVRLPLPARGASAVQRSRSPTVRRGLAATARCCEPQRVGSRVSFFGYLLRSRPPLRETTLNTSPASIISRR